MAEYRVVPFVATVEGNQRAQQAAGQLASRIETWSNNGWEYVRLESVEAYIPATGCFGFGGTPERFVWYSMVVFKR